MPKLPPHSQEIAVGLLGSVVMPHNLFLQSGLVLNKDIRRERTSIRYACRYTSLETAVALLASFLINMSVLLVAASSFAPYWCAPTEQVCPNTVCVCVRVCVCAQRLPECRANGTGLPQHSGSLVRGRADRVVLCSGARDGSQNFREAGRRQRILPVGRGAPGKWPELDCHRHVRGAVCYAGLHPPVPAYVGAQSGLAPGGHLASAVRLSGIRRKGRQRSHCVFFGGALSPSAPGARAVAEADRLATKDGQLRQPSALVRTCRPPLSCVYARSAALLAASVPTDPGENLTGMLNAGLRCRGG